MITNEQTAQQIARVPSRSLDWNLRELDESMRSFAKRNRVIRFEAIKRILDERDAAEAHSFDEPPTDMRDILMWSVISENWVAGFYGDNQGKVYCNGGFMKIVDVSELYTHWREMPAGPREDGGS